MILTWYGHSCVHIITSDGIRVLIDPFMDDNPSCPLSSTEIEADFIVLTHAHNDHVGDAPVISKRCQAPIIAMVELADFLHDEFDVPVIHVNIGGTVHGNFGSIKFVQAIHSSTYFHKGKNLPMGLAAGIVLDDGSTKVYHAGDTALFSDMALLEPVHIAFLPIGDKFTMGIEDAIKASERIKSEAYIPIHYNTFEAIAQNPYHYINRLPEANGFVPEIGRSFNEFCIPL